MFFIRYWTQVKLLLDKIKVPLIPQQSTELRISTALWGSEALTAERETCSTISGLVCKPFPKYACPRNKRRLQKQNGCLLPERPLQISCLRPLIIVFLLVKKTMMQGFLIFKCISKVFLFGRKKVGCAKKFCFQKKIMEVVSGGVLCIFFFHSEVRGNSLMNSESC